MLSIHLSDVLGTQSDIDFSIYDRSNHEAFLGHIKVYPELNEHNAKLEGWYKLEARDPQEDQVSGEIHLEVLFQKTEKKQYGPGDFQILKLIGKGSGSNIFVFILYLTCVQQARSGKFTRYEKKILKGFMP